MTQEHEQPRGGGTEGRGSPGEVTQREGGAPGTFNQHFPNAGAAEFWSTTLATAAPNAWIFPLPKKNPKELDAPLCPVLPTDIPGAPPSCWEMPFLEETTPRASYGKEEHEDWEYFPLRWENTQPAPFPPFCLSKTAIKREDVLAVINISLENARLLAQLPNPTLQKQLGALGNTRIAAKNPIFLLRVAEAAPAGYSRQDGAAAGRQIPKDRVSPPPASPVGFSHIHLGKAAPQDPWGWPESRGIRLLRRACRHLPSRRANKQVAKSQQNHESKTTEPQSASESLPGRRHGPTALPKNSPPPAAAAPRSKGPLQRGWKEFSSRESLSERAQVWMEELR